MVTYTYSFTDDFGGSHKMRYFYDTFEQKAYYPKFHTLLIESDDALVCYFNEELTVQEKEDFDALIAHFKSAALSNLPALIEASIEYAPRAWEPTFSFGNNDTRQIRFQGDNSPVILEARYPGFKVAKFNKVSLFVGGTGLGGSKEALLEMRHKETGNVVSSAVWNTNPRHEIQLTSFSNIPYNEGTFEFIGTTGSANARGFVFGVSFVQSGIIGQEYPVVVSDSTYDVVFNNSGVSVTTDFVNGNDILLIDDIMIETDSSLNTKEYQIINNLNGTYTIGYREYNPWWIGTIDSLNQFKIIVTNFEFVQFNDTAVDLSNY